MSEVRLIENFVSWQGEGPHSGRTMVILRFKTCNLKCPWCDTSVKMRISAEAPYKVSDIQKTLYERNAGILITGGEPTSQRHFDDTIKLLTELDYPIANVESNGYNLYGLIQQVKDNGKITHLYSPKIFNEKDLTEAIQLTELLAPVKNVHIKVVYEDNPLVIKYLEVIKDRYKSLSWKHRVWLMPEGVTREQLIYNSEKVFDVCERYGFNFSSRNHIIFGFV